MARRPKPRWWSQGGEWCVTIDGQRHRLGPDKEQAERLFHELMARPEKGMPSGSVASIIDLFLDWTQRHNAEETYLWYRKHLQSFLDALIPRTLTVDRLKPHHVDAWVDAHEWGDSLHLQMILLHLRSNFRNLVVTAWETGARPQEIVRVEARHVELQNGRRRFSAFWPPLSR